MKTLALHIKTLLATVMVVAMPLGLYAQLTHDHLPVIKANSTSADYRIGNKLFHGRWRISPQTIPDILIIRPDSDSTDVAFYTDRDSLVRTMGRKDSVQFYVLLEDGRYALTELRTVPYQVYRPLTGFTAFHENGALVKKPITVTFIAEDGSIQHKYIHSLTVWTLDSIVFQNGNPDRQKLMGSPLPLSFRRQGDSLLIETFSPEYYALLVAYHTIRALEYFDTLFAGYLDFEGQAGFENIKILFGRYVNSSPKEFAFPLGAHVSPTLVYHEMGHRAFWLIKDTLRIGEVGDWLHMGLLEYFTVSLADHPVVLEGLVPSLLVRDASKSLRFPDDVLNYADSWSQYYEAYKDSFPAAPMYKKLYDINLRRMASWDSVYKMTDVARKYCIEAHKSGLVITHPLWQLRSQLGASKCDRLVKTAMLLLPSLLPRRIEYLYATVNVPSAVAQWYDFVYALRVADRKLYQGDNVGLINKMFTGAGFDLNTHIK